ncbi:MAG TPA: hypothetical protein VF868_16735 [Bacteroidia bacterium]|jgi:hypothetical protein
MKKAVLLFLLTVLSFVNSYSQDSTRTGLLYGFNNAYYLTAPVGWVMDNENGKEQGLTAVFYPEGSAWDTGETVMYTTFGSFDSTKNETLNEFIAHDSTLFRSRSPQASVRAQAPIVIGKNKAAKVYAYSDPENKNYDLIAYIEEKKGVVMIVVTSLNNNGCINNYGSFQSLVKSYRFLTDKVNIQLGK